MLLVAAPTVVIRDRRPSRLWARYVIGVSTCEQCGIQLSRPLQVPVAA